MPQVLNQIPSVDDAGKITPSRHDFTISPTRIYELALHRWLQSRFFIAEGLPVPVVFSKPARAFQSANEEFQKPGGPYAYLLSYKDAQGNPLYASYPAPLMLPLISVDRQRWALDPTRNSGVHQNRYVGWPTVSPDVARKNLGNVLVTRSPQAWNYYFQVDFWSKSMATNAELIGAWMQAFLLSASEPNVWIKTIYPSHIGAKLVSMVQQGDITDTSDFLPETNTMVYKFSVNLMLKAWHYDYDLQVAPALWNAAFVNGPVDPETMQILYEADLTGDSKHSILGERDNIPAV